MDGLCFLGLGGLCISYLLKRDGGRGCNDGLMEGYGW